MNVSENVWAVRCCYRGRHGRGEPWLYCGRIPETFTTREGARARCAELRSKSWWEPRMAAQPIRVLVVVTTEAAE